MRRGICLIFVTFFVRLTKNLLGLEDAFAHLVNSVRDYAIFLLDRSGHVASWNPGAERIKGYGAAEILGQHFSMFYPDEARQRRWPEQQLDLAERHGRFEDQGWRIGMGGRRFWADVVITALRDAKGELRGFAKITRDPTILVPLPATGRCMTGCALRRPVSTTTSPSRWSFRRCSGCYRRKNRDRPHFRDS